MDSPWFVVLITLCLCWVLKSLLNLFQKTRHRDNTNMMKPKLPPGPLNIPILSDLQWLRRQSSALQPILRKLHAQYGPIFTLKMGGRRSVFISNHELAHKALIRQHGATFSDRPPAAESSQIMTSNQHNIATAEYGPVWRLLRRNLTSEIFHPSRLKSYAHARKWVLDKLKKNLRSESELGSKPVRVIDHFIHVMFCLIVFMCFGETYEEKVIREIEEVIRDVILSSNTAMVLSLFPKLSKIIFYKRWSGLMKLRSKQERMILPLIIARQDKMKKKQQQQQQQGDEESSEDVLAYVDTLFNLSLPEYEERKLTEQEMVTLCSEFIIGGTDTTTTTLQWIMAMLVKHQEIQKKLYSEIKETVSSSSDCDDDEIKEEQLQKMPYLKAVVLEGLRRHPPGHLVVPHAVTEDVILDGYLVPKDATVNFMVAEMGWDPKVWEDPMEFKPERFMKEEQVCDITGSREVKMMPFGVGRRICAGLGVAMLHLEYFVANLVREFEWTAREGDDIDLSEKHEYTTVMKYPLWAHVSPRA